MASKKEKERKSLKEEEEMKKLHELLLNLEMVEMAQDLNLLEKGKKTPSAGPAKKKEEKSESP